CISKPVIGRTTGKWSIQLTRRIDKAAGSFGGVIVASLDPSYLTRIYDSVNVGIDGHIRVIGTDGIVRATSGSSQAIVGKDWSNGDLFRNYSAAKPSGWHYTGSKLSDRVPRLIVYRAVKDYPLIIAIGRSTHEIFAPFDLE